MRFQKGNSGRPLGAKNKNYLVPSMWLSLLWDDIQDMIADKRIPHIKWAVEQMMPKIPGISATPEDSTVNAALVAALEAKRRLANAPTTPLDSGGLDSRGGNGSNGSTTP